MYGEISVDELKKYSMLGLIFLFIIGSYWLLRPLKDAVFFSVVGGKAYQPYAKMLSLVVVVLMVVVYSKLVDLFSRERLFYIIMAFFSLSFFALTALLAHPTIGLANKEPSPWRFIGWYSYFLVECYGSITVSMFWSFVASCTQSSSAARGYSIIIGGAQFGSITGPLLAANAETLGIVPLYAISGICTTIIALLLRLFLYVIPQTLPHDANNNNNSSSNTTNSASSVNNSTNSNVQIDVSTAKDNNASPLTPTSGALIVSKESGNNNNNNSNSNSNNGGNSTIDKHAAKQASSFFEGLVIKYRSIVFGLLN